MSTSTLSFNTTVRKVKRPTSTPNTYTPTTVTFSTSSTVSSTSNVPRKRLLTAEEIEDILQVVKPTNDNISDDDVPIYNARQSLRLQLNNLYIYPQLIPKFKEQVQKQYFRSLLQPGEMVGVIAASSIGEQNTQASLNRYLKFLYCRYYGLKF